MGFVHMTDDSVALLRFPKAREGSKYTNIRACENLIIDYQLTCAAVFAINSAIYDCGAERNETSWQPHTVDSEPLGDVHEQSPAAIPAPN